MNRCLPVWIVLLLLLLTTGKAICQPTLPDITGSNEKGIVIISWVCQFDGVKSISVRRSADSSCNYSTIGYVKNVLKGTQAFADGHPYPGKNFYKLSIVFTSGLTWTSNHFGVIVDSQSIRSRRSLPNNEALQTLIVTDNTEKEAPPAKTTPPSKTTRKNTIPAGDVSRYMEVVPKDTAAAAAPANKKIKLIQEPDNYDPSTYLETLPSASRQRIKINYADEPADTDASRYVDVPRPTEPKKRISITFDDRDDANMFMETMPKTQPHKITLIINDTVPTGTAAAKAPAKKIVLNFDDEAAAQYYIEHLPDDNSKKITVSYAVDSLPGRTNPQVTQPAPKPKIKLNFPDESATNTTLEVKSKYITVDAITGHIQITLPDDMTAHHYALKFYDKDNHAVIDVPKLNARFLIMDKRNFQRKGQYKFTIRKDVTEFESGYITIY